MADGRGFWSSVPGLITGAAGLLTALVGLLTMSVQQGWIGDGKGGSATSTTTSGGAAGSDQSTVTAASGAGAGTVAFELRPETLSFAAVGSAERTVTLRNTGGVSFATDRAEVTGADASRFTVDDADCRGPKLAPRDTCDLVLTYTAGGLAGAASATLEVAVAGSGRVEKVDLKAGIL